MFLKKLLILLYKNIKLLLLMVILSSCGNILYYPKEINNLFYINNINEQYGMLLKNNIQSVFNNNNLNTAKYIVNVKLSLTESLSLTNTSGYATRGNINITVTTVIINKENSSILATINNNFNEIYNIQPNSFTTNINKEKAIDYLISTIANDIILQINLFIKRNYEDII